MNFIRLAGVMGLVLFVTSQLACTNGQSTNHEAKATFSRHAMGDVTVINGHVMVDLDVSMISLGENGIPDTCFDDGVYYHIHSMWAHTNMSDYQGTTDCGPAMTGGHWDPWFACSTSSSGVDCRDNGGCIWGSSAVEVNGTYQCNENTWDSHGFACEVSDFSGKYGMARVSNNMISVDEMHWMEIDGVDFDAQYSVVFHCGTGERAFCAPFQVTELEETSFERDMGSDSATVSFSSLSAGDFSFSGTQIEIGNGWVKVDISARVAEACSNWELTVHDAWEYPSTEPQTNGNCIKNFTGGVWDPTHSCITDSGSIYCTNGVRCPASTATEVAYQCNNEENALRCAIGDIAGRIGRHNVGDGSSSFSQTYEDRISMHIEQLAGKSLVMECTNENDFLANGIIRVCKGISSSDLSINASNSSALEDEMTAGGVIAIILLIIVFIGVTYAYFRGKSPEDTNNPRVALTQQGQTLGAVKSISDETEQAEQADQGDRTPERRPTQASRGEPAPRPPRPQQQQRQQTRGEKKKYKGGAIKYTGGAVGSPSGGSPGTNGSNGGKQKYTGGAVEYNKSGSFASAVSVASASSATTASNGSNGSSGSSPPALAPGAYNNNGAVEVMSTSASPRKVAAAPVHGKAPPPPPQRRGTAVGAAAGEAGVETRESAVSDYGAPPDVAEKFETPGKLPPPPRSLSEAEPAVLQEQQGLEVAQHAQQEPVQQVRLSQFEQYEQYSEAQGYQLQQSQQLPLHEPPPRLSQVQQYEEPEAVQPEQAQPVQQVQQVQQVQPVQHTQPVQQQVQQVQQAQEVPAPVVARKKPAASDLMNAMKGLKTAKTNDKKSKKAEEESGGRVNMAAKMGKFRMQMGYGNDDDSDDDEFSTVGAGKVDDKNNDDNNVNDANDVNDVSDVNAEYEMNETIVGDVEQVREANNAIEANEDVLEVEDEGGAAGAAGVGNDAQNYQNENGLEYGNSAVNNNQADGSYANTGGNNAYDGNNANNVENNYNNNGYEQNYDNNYGNELEYGGAGPEGGQEDYEMVNANNYGSTPGGRAVPPRPPARNGEKNEVDDGVLREATPEQPALDFEVVNGTLPLDELGDPQYEDLGI